MQPGRKPVQKGGGRVIGDTVVLFRWTARSVRAGATSLAKGQLTGSPAFRGAAGGFPDLYTIPNFGRHLYTIPNSVHPKRRPPLNRYRHRPDCRACGTGPLPYGANRRENAGSRCKMPKCTLNSEQRAKTRPAPAVSGSARLRVARARAETCPIFAAENSSCPRCRIRAKSARPSLSGPVSRLARTCRGSLELRFGLCSGSAETGKGFEQRPGPLLVRRRFEQACERGERHDASSEHPSCCIKRAAFLVGF